MQKGEVLERFRDDTQTNIVRKIQSLHDLDDDDDKAVYDVTLKAGDYSVQAHRANLAAKSDYFHAMFSGRWSEKENTEITLHEITPVGLKAIFEFVYLGRITMDTENVVDIVSAIHHCQFEAAYKMCEDFIAKKIDESNFYDLLRLSEMYDLNILLAKLAEFATKLFMPRFPMVDHCAFFKQLDLFSSSFLRLVLKTWDFSDAGFGKIGVYDLIATWVCQDLSKREHLLRDLLSAVADGVYVNEALRYAKLKPADRLQEAKVEGPRLVSVVSKDICEQMPLFKDDFVCYDFDTNLIKEMAPFPAMVGTNLWESGIVVMNNILYVVGVRNLVTYAVDSCYRYDPCLDKWSPIEPLQTSRTQCPVVALNGKLIVLGGSAVNRMILDTVEVYDPITDTWSYGVPMPGLLKHHAATTHQGSVYVTGGEKEAKSRLRQVLCYASEKLSWSQKEDMIMARSGHVAVTHKDRMYQIDGLSPLQPFSANAPLIEYYDFDTDSATHVTWTGIDLTSDLNDLNVDGGLSTGGFMHFCVSRDYNDGDDECGKIKVFRFDSNYKQMVEVFQKERGKDDYKCWVSLSFPKFVLEHLPASAEKPETKSD
ncbi:kelch-like protein 13 isoform X1 [Lineus longissimus]|uniref:kelch-like protein 13 isoform X1 n=1 Tax=Lineus longissimus TaxID=88925 RepID=UPI002B4DED2C